MHFDDPTLLDQISYDLIFSDAPRGRNRALIADCANGVPPLTQSEVEQSNAAVNYNDLSMTKALHSSRLSFYNGFLKSGNFFRCTTDSGSRDRRTTYSEIVTKEINKPLKRSVPYFESYRSKIGLLCLHGIAPNVWENEDKWCTKPLGVDSVLLPSETLIGFTNLPFFFLRRSFTAMELKKITQASKRDPGWNMPFVNRCIEWMEEQMTLLRGNYWPDWMSPERVSERSKENSGNFSANDRAPVINVFDVYWWDDSGDEQGWVRRIILDTWTQPTPVGNGYQVDRRSDMGNLTKKDKTTKPAWEEFLFTSGKNKVAQSWQNILSLQYADLSAVAPFRHYSTRSLGFLLYGVCTVQNRLNIKFTEATFETLMQLFRVKSMEDVQRALKLNLYNRGFIDENIQTIPAAERWQPNFDLVNLALTRNIDTIQSSTGSFAPTQDFSQNGVEKTRFQVMAEIGADTSLISAALMQAYKYQNFEDQEIFRRFLKPNSTDPDVREFRARVLKQRVPEDVLVPEAWEVEHEQVLGGGNKTMEMTQAQQLLQMYQLYDPTAQRKILYDVTLAFTDDAARARDLVPEQPTISDSIHDSELAFGTLMQGSMVTPKPGLNATEVASTIIRLMGQRVQLIQATSGIGTPSDLIGLQMASQYAGAFIQQLSQDPESKQTVKQLGDALGQVTNLIKAMAQQQQEAAQKAQEQNGNGQMDPEAMAKIQALMMQAQAKAQNSRESHAEKTAQRQISFEQKTKQEQQKHALDLKVKAQDSKLKIATDRAKAITDIVKARSKPVGGSKE